VRELSLAAPYGVAILLYLMAPLLTNGVIRTIVAVIDKGRADLPGVDSKQIPYYLSQDLIEDYVEYTADAAQVMPVILLPIVGAIYSFSSVPTPVSVTFLIVVALVAVGMLLWILARYPSDYVSRKWHGYSILTMVGIVLNLIGMSLVLALS
jgi:hypothetical protein